MGFGIIVTYIYASVGFNFFWVDYTYSTNGGDGPDIVLHQFPLSYLNRKVQLDVEH